MRIAVAAAAFLAFASCAQAEEVAYFAIYYQGADQITLNAQATPIPVPAVGSAIEVSDQGRGLRGYVRSVSHEVQRTSGPVPFRFYILKVEIDPTVPARATGPRGFRR
ncbi:MAG: hypothetical protein CL858_28180 [Cupriavidus sp.]|uniref:Uncharacterized protein n=1 Tax=Methylobacterium brachiatum TaxID=269660 RepID=A0AAJ1TVI8_9HYPH|nr:hypothetical protein [Methylobacterium sp.]EIZ84858.1 hypothetical protein WYO_2542 [Methylobacterium sp. GXF4]MBP31615.1 hypothetical protein [Methylobacterium sp.]MBU69264.1 hypothetical protein [Cupriavidus sp.]MDQ0545589.1 hypothetical protein [Methylobacterium brachiatum]